MKDDFTTILSELKDSMTNKVNELTSSDLFDSYTQGRIKNVNKRIAGLESSAREIIEDYSDHPDMLVNFRKRANDIMMEINGLY